MPCAVAIKARPTMYISEPTTMIGTEAVAHRHGAGERLQKSPGEVLHGQRQREIDTEIRCRASAAA